MARSSSARRPPARGLAAVAAAIAMVLIAPRGAAAQPSLTVAASLAAERSPVVEAPDASGLLARCVEGADALWRGRPQQAERLARAALGPGAAPYPRDPVLRHALARCQALLGRAILARGSRDPAVVEGAAQALRRAWALEPSADLVGPLVSAQWLAARGAVWPRPAFAMSEASAAERAAIGARAGRARARTLRRLPATGASIWNLVAVESAGATELRAVACTPLRCVASELFTMRAGEDARLAGVGFVATPGGLALVLDVDHTLALVDDGVTRAAWRGSAVYVRWLDRGRPRGWNVLTRSRTTRWEREHVEARRPPAIDVQVRWARGRRVVLRSASPTAGRALEDVLGLRDPRALDCDACWLGALRPPAGL